MGILEGVIRNDYGSPRARYPNVSTVSSRFSFHEVQTQPSIQLHSPMEPPFIPQIEGENIAINHVLARAGLQRQGRISSSLTDQVIQRSTSIIVTYLLDEVPEFLELAELRRQVRILKGSGYCGLMLTRHRDGRTLRAIATSIINVVRQTRRINKHRNITIVLYKKLARRFTIPLWVLPRGRFQELSSICVSPPEAFSQPPRD
jgi:hypothetical protein